MHKRTELILKLSRECDEDDSSSSEDLPLSSLRNTENDYVAVKEALNSILNFAENECPFRMDEIENSDFSDMDPDYVPSENDLEELRELGKEPEVTGVTRKRKMTLKVKQGRKKTRNVDEWKDKKAKKELDLGVEHQNRKGKLITSRKMRFGCKDSCRNKCGEKLSEGQRRRIFQDFWKLGDHTRQWDCVARCVQQIHRKQIINKNHSRRKFSRTYKFVVDHNDIKVCKTMFLNTLGISETWVTTTMKKVGESGNLEEDKRGSHSVRPHRISDIIKENVREHINLFPLVPSHYIRKDSNKMYLEEGLSISKMYRLYTEYARDNSVPESDVATERQYREILNSEFNIGFFKPKKDQCQLCAAYGNADARAKSTMKLKYEAHLANKNAARSLKEQCKEMAIADKTVCAACFDLQKVLPTPQSEVSTFFYRSKIATYNFTVYDMGNNEGYCYVWYEELARRGPNEIGSCLLDFLKKQKQKGVSRVFLFSDNCGGQNRNRFIFSMFAYASSLLKIEIIHRFLEKGHTQNEGDSMHAVIENSRKRQGAIYTPSQWVTLIKMSKVTGKPYIVKEMAQADFFNFSSMVKDQNWKLDKNREIVKISKIRELAWSADSPDRVLFKYEFNETARELVILKRPNRKRLVDCPNPLPELYNSPLAIDAKKLKGLLELCKGKEPDIPSMYHNFFSSLKSTEVELPSKTGKMPERELRNEGDESESEEESD